MQPLDNSLNWFEISVDEMERAKHFYESILGITLTLGEIAGSEMAFFPTVGGNGKVGGALAKGPFHKPSMDGIKVYLNANPNLSFALDNVEKAGGKVVLSKTSIGQFGFIAFFIDSESNVIGLHSIN